MNIFKRLFRKRNFELDSDSITKNRASLIKHIDETIRKTEAIIQKNFPDDIELEELVSELFDDLILCSEQLRSDRWKDNLQSAELKRNR